MAYTFPQLRQFAVNAGFTGSAADTAAAISLAESSGVPGKINWRDPQGSFGLMQINQAAHPGTASQALDPQGSFDLAYAISQGGANFTPWSTFNNGAYAANLPGGMGSAGNGSTILTFDQGQNPAGVFGDNGSGIGVTGVPGADANGNTGGFITDPTTGMTIPVLPGGTSNPGFGSGPGGTGGATGNNPASTGQGGSLNIVGAIGGGISSLIGAVETWIGRGLVGLLALGLVLAGIIWLALETKTGQRIVATASRAIV